ncbi:MAG: DNA/RNA helicase domain-containing protein [Patescibacteria group bacterium]
MLDIKTFPFSESGIQQMRKSPNAIDWPIVYLIENGKDLYVGETIHASARTKQHLENPERKTLKTIHVISDDEFNKSATLDAESSLIEYFAADGKYSLQNGNGGLQNHDYFDREKYQAKFEVLWEKLREMHIAQHSLFHIRNTDLFKYSPYKTLTDDQYFLATYLLADLTADVERRYLIHGGPGTGKTILAIYIVKQLVEQGKKNVALVIAMTSLRNTLKKVFRAVPGLRSDMVIGPNDVTKRHYDTLIVDEAHRLRRRRNIPNYASFDQTNKRFGLGTEGTELDWISRSAKQVILFFDENQSVRPSDIPVEVIKSSAETHFRLSAQIRVQGGEEYIHFVDNILEVKPAEYVQVAKYDFQIFEDISEMIRELKEKEKIHGLCRLVAGYAWEWVSRDDAKTPDIIIGNTKLFWNSTIQDWVNSPNAINEVGCIHTIQGYDLNYAGVIVGPEVTFDASRNCIVIKKEEYRDANGYRGIVDQEELKRYIINIYKTLLTRGILGTYVYIVDPDLRRYFQSTLR